MKIGLGFGIIKKIAKRRRQKAKQEFPFILFISNLLLLKLKSHFLDHLSSNLTNYPFFDKENFF
jgi:hypothetical protein